MAVFTFHTWKTNRVVLDFASASGTIFFCKPASLHLLHEQVEIGCHQLSIILSNYWYRLEIFPVDKLRPTKVSRLSRETNAIRRVHHPQPHRRVFPVLASSSCSRLGGFHELHDTLSYPWRNIRTNETVASLPSLYRVVNVSEGGRIANGPLWSFTHRSVLAVEAADADLTNNNLDTMRLSVAWRRHIFWVSTESLDAVSSHKAV
jgi:hypothetical protein